MEKFGHNKNKLSGKVQAMAPLKWFRKTLKLQWIHIKSLAESA